MPLPSGAKRPEEFPPVEQTPEAWNGFVECQAERCPAQQGCYLLLSTPRDSCCSVCKGCEYMGRSYASGEEWKDPDNPCRVFTCKAGVVTESEEVCYVPCPHSQSLPPEPGQCCRTCPTCPMSEKDRDRDSRSVTLAEDPCVSCQCRGGRLACSKKACPVLNCPQSTIEQLPGQCCPVCKGSRRLLYELPAGSCLLGTEMKASGRSFHVDHCTTCSCVNGTSLCRRPSCPALDCPAEQQQTAPGQCCSTCTTALESRAACTLSGQTYQDGQQWRLGPCKWCMCSGGVARCTVERCPAQQQCPPHQRLQQVDAECCPKCVDTDGVCAVFGDPHYRTFDGKFFSFQGSCKYQLAADCVDHKFSIRVTNDARATKTSSWTKTVSIKVGSVKVNLGQRLRVKVNGVRITPPFRLAGTPGNASGGGLPGVDASSEVTVEKREDTVLVTTGVGVKVTWDGNSFLEVSVPTSFKNKLCGLCGNYNSLARDDLATRRGRLAADVERFAASWRVGGRHACARPGRAGLGLGMGPGRPRQQHHQDAPNSCLRLSSTRRIRDYRRCKPLIADAFAACHKKVNAEMYFKSCLLDMCECPSGRCYCEAFTAYAYECRRAGAALGDWRAATGCVAGWAEEARVPIGPPFPPHQRPRGGHHHGGNHRGGNRGGGGGKGGGAGAGAGAGGRAHPSSTTVSSYPRVAQLQQLTGLSGLRLPQPGASRPPPPTLH
ncbi:BMP-binding endothelial regulator protein [Frankliniella fusca]|uniref:BMP-binding endothelial regulator protein n=1 Tax=Frankliniella fusca TaxID=407009 RepID=A0AAE1H8M1_9NEOP|nr:BMP-binding endothelial regulator protein [Frankliniella fusca]